MKIVAIVQARVHSTRLPNKVLLPLKGKPMLQRVLERTKTATLLDAVVCAVPARDAAVLTPLIEQAGCRPFAFAGDESDLLARYLAAAEAFGAEIIVRIGSDNPCIEGHYLDEIIDEYLCQPIVFASNAACVCILREGCGCLVDGLGGEIYSRSRLRWLDHQTRSFPAYREHPHRYFYEHGFNPLVAHLRLDVNTPADYAFMRDLYEHVPEGFTIQDVLAYLDRKGVISHGTQAV